MFEIQSYIKVNDEFIAIEDIKGNSVYKKWIKDLSKVRLLLNIIHR